MSAWSSEHGLVLAQQRVDSKSNEITAVPVLLKLLNLKGTVVTLDALAKPCPIGLLGTQTAIATQIKQAEGDYVLDKINHYRTCIQTLLEQHSQSKNNNEEVEDELFFNTVRDHYQLMRVGWNGLSRIYHTVLYFDIKDGKIWLQQNTTDIDVGQELIDMGSS